MGGGVSDVCVAEAFHAWHKKYGSTYRVWMGWSVVIVSNDTAYVKQVLVTDRGQWSVSRPALKQTAGAFVHLSTPRHLYYLLPP